MLKYFILICLWLKNSFYFGWIWPELYLYFFAQHGQNSICSCTDNVVVFNGVHEYNTDTSIQKNQYRGHNIIYGKNIRYNTITTNISMSIKFYIKHNIEMLSIKQLAFVRHVQIYKKIFKIFDTEIHFKL